MPDVKEWLPKEAFTESIVKAILSDPLARWSRRWISRQPVVVQSVRRTPDKGRGSAGGQMLRANGARADVELPGRGKRALLEALLDVDLAAQSLSENDHKVLDVLAEQAIVDLAGALDEMFDAAGESTGAILLEANVGFAGGTEFAILQFFDSAIVQLVKEHHGVARASQTPPRSRLAVLKTMKITAEGILGQAELALDDVRNIAVGDVVPLDRLLQEPVELRIAESGRAIGRGKLCQNDGQISIQL